MIAALHWQASSWATGCRSKKGMHAADRHKGGEEEGDSLGKREGEAGRVDSVVLGTEAGGLGAEEKEHVGRCCKRLIDVGRLVYVREQLGLEAELVSYAPQSLTPENVLLLAWCGE